jgi:hypothetical protein
VSLRSRLCRNVASSKLTRDPVTGKLCRCYPPLDPCITCPGTLELVFSGLGGVFADWNGAWTVVRGTPPGEDACTYYIVGAPGDYPAGFELGMVIGQGAWVVGLVYVGVPASSPPSCQVWWDAPGYSSCPPEGEWDWGGCANPLGCAEGSCPDSAPYPTCTVSVPT